MSMRMFAEQSLRISGITQARLSNALREADRQSDLLPKCDSYLCGRVIYDVPNDLSLNCEPVFSGGPRDPALHSRYPTDLPAGCYGTVDVQSMGEGIQQRAVISAWLTGRCVDPGRSPLNAVTLIRLEAQWIESAPFDSTLPESSDPLITQREANPPMALRAP
ncbi:hypothetical protein BC629DRAFT_1594946 [Irpex lacteus]|nr:hypothetical protein BC629DRAFT_1594946 [Irpex lacteus]